MRSSYSRAFRERGLAGSKALGQEEAGAAGVTLEGPGEDREVNWPEGVSRQARDRVTCILAPLVTRG